MTTFSPAKDPYVGANIETSDKASLGKGIRDLGRRLVNLMEKVGCHTSAYQG